MTKVVMPLECYKKFRKNHNRTPVKKSFFGEVADPVYYTDYAFLQET